MKIVIPVENKEINSDTCNSFGRAPYFLIYDTENRKKIYLDNNAAETSGGAGVKAAQTIADNNIDIVITAKCGENAYEVLKGSDIKIYKKILDKADENLIAFREGKLEELKETHSGYHLHGGR
ncbi:putative Fe-Mo cluster-binding NifX family protein [Acetoanaerobium pronyense]|uniref:Fe-Mo cluster-binding NifX family protein n=1 Tax=Acetoanaerobium pronyense TaxID=1482736 RepID=A0ABS4KG71_9FIRM|nr:NifB/NifX family molybdenum-iron cluster-binding protein [Acetoanaerobium pronyense]MBP2026765.1 putative Fe-Mo cluster-binding NifX family protein [Acetoanaerobium pronyense]